MGPLLIVLLQPAIQTSLQLFEGRVQFLAKHHAVKLILHGAMKSFADAIGRRRFRSRPAVIDVLHCQIELILMMLALAAVLGSTICQNAQQGSMSAATSAFLRSYSFANATFV